jgi:hypothetical protein
MLFLKRDQMLLLKRTATPVPKLSPEQIAWFIAARALLESRERDVRRITVIIDPAFRPPHKRARQKERGCVARFNPNGAQSGLRV